MKVLVKFKINTQEEIDLTDCGYDESQRWDDLTEEEQNEILDPIRIQQIPDVSVTEIEENN
jgi:hypothetical protein